jgi:ankyrin repeat protein
MNLLLCRCVLQVPTGMTPLMVAIENRNSEFVSRLLEAGAGKQCPCNSHMPTSPHRRLRFFFFYDAILQNRNGRIHCL